jgi:hypothetical protein
LFSKVNFAIEDISIKNDAVCFTDVPLNMMDGHVKNYGKFAIGFKKEFVKNSGGNPVLYFVDHTTINGLRGIISSNLKTILKFTVSNYKILKEDGSEYNSNELKDNLMQFLSHCKEIGDLGPPSDGSERVDAYFVEREWRIVRYNRHKDLEMLTTIDEQHYLKTTVDDIRTIIVPNKDIARMVIEYLQESGTKNIPIIIEYDELKYL